MITFIKLVCPNCGANLEVDSKLSQCFCQYCGTKILLHNENEQVTRIIDEAGLAQQETERLRITLEKEKLEHEEKNKQREMKQGLWALFFFLAAGFGPYSILCIIRGFRYGTFGTISIAMLSIVGLIAIVLGFLPTVDVIKLKKSYGVLLMFIGAAILIASLAYLIPLVA